MEREKRDSIPEDSNSVNLIRMLYGGIFQKAISVVAKLGIADFLANGPLSTAELAKKTNTHENALYRVLRMLASIGVFKEQENRIFELTALASYLQSDNPDSIRNYAIMMGEDWLWDNWKEMLYSLQTGKTSQSKVHKMDSFEFFTQNKEAGEIFNRAMTDISKPDIPAFIHAYDFSGIRHIVDIAGGHGKLLAGVLQSNPDMRGALFDLPSVIESAGQLLKKEGVENRVNLVPGSFFDSVPEQADAYMMKHIIHDWDDEYCKKILQNVRKVIGKNGKLLILEMVVPEGNQPNPAKVLDIQMLLTAGGKERTEDEFRKLLHNAGFSLARIIPTQSPMCVIEAVPD